MPNGVYAGSTEGVNAEPLLDPFNFYVCFLFRRIIGYVFFPLKTGFRKDLWAPAKYVLFMTGFSAAKLFLIVLLSWGVVFLIVWGFSSFVFILLYAAVWFGCWKGDSEVFQTKNIKTDIESRQVGDLNQTHFCH